MKRIFALVLSLMLVLSLCGFASAEEGKVNVASLKGPTSMGLAKLMQDEESNYAFDVYGTADEIVPQLVQGKIDIALVPCNLASVLYNNTDGAVEVAAVSTLGVLYVVETGDAIQSVSDLQGMTVYSTGKGTTPEYALRHILTLNGVDPDQDLTIEYKSEATEVAAALESGAVSCAVLPQPYVTAVLAQNENARVALSLTDEWAKADPESQLITGVVLVRRAFAEENPDALAAFLADYDASQAYVNENPAEAGVWIADMGIVAKAALAEKAIPACNIVCVTGEEMKLAVGGYLAALYAQNPESVGGALPGDDFYYLP